LATLSGHQSYVRSCGWSPDGLRILSASDDYTLRIWDARAGQCLATLSGHQKYVLGCAWSPDGLHILSSSHDGTLIVWDAETGTRIAPEIHRLRAPHGHPSWCSIDPQQNRILACGSEAWRSLGWVVPDANGLPELLPAETFGPLPVK
jgi:WD40 repeat protein